MPQVFQVLKCYKCFVFQIHQTKKSNKFECKVCGEKQSIKRHYGIGTGKDCRMHVQKLNVLRGEMDVKSVIDTSSDDDGKIEKIHENTRNSNGNSVKRSKWSTFIDKEQEAEVNEEPMFLGNTEVHLEIPQKSKKRKLKTHCKVNNSKLDSVNDQCSLDLNCNSKLIDNKITEHNELEDLLFDQNSMLINPYSYEEKNSSINIDNVAKKALEKPVLQTINKNSKWTEYIDIEEYDLHNTYPDVEECDKNSENLFSLCDDTELDQVLDI